MASQNVQPSPALRELTEGAALEAYSRIVQLFGTMLSKTILNDLAHADLPYVEATPDASAESVRVMKLWQSLRGALANEARDYLRETRQIELTARQLANSALRTPADIEWMALRARLSSVERDPISAAEEASAVLTGLEQLSVAEADSEELLSELQLICLLFAGLPLSFTDPWSLSAWLVGRGGVLFVDMANLAVRTHQGESLGASAGERVRRFLAFMNSARSTYAVDATHVAYLAIRLARLTAAALPDEALSYLEFVRRSTAENISTHFDAVDLSAECSLIQGNHERAATLFQTLTGLGLRFNDPISVALGASGAAVAVGGPADIAGELKRHTALRYLKCVFRETPAGDDPSTRYVLKRGADHVFQAAAAVGAGSADPVDRELVAAALWCATSAEFALRIIEEDRLLVAHVRQEQIGELMLAVAKAGDRSAIYSQLLRDLVPLAMLESMRERLDPGEAVLIVLPVGKGCVWAAITRGTGFSTGAFDASDELATLRELLEQQFPADLLDDVTLVTAIDRDVREQSSRLTARVQRELVTIVESAETIYYVAGASTTHDGFPLEMLSVDGRLLCERAVVTRAPSIEWLRAHFADMQSFAPRVDATGQFMVVAGAEELEEVRLEAQDAAIQSVTDRLRALGFQGSTVSIDSDLESLKLSNVSVLHFIGHGLATDAYEGLPSRHDAILDAGRIRRLAVRPDLAVMEACTVGRMRYVQGGLHDGLPSALVSSGVGAVVAFCKPVLESRAREVVDRIYGQLKQMPAGEAVRQARTSMAAPTLAYMQAALLYYGDASPRLSSRTAAVRAARAGWRTQVIRHLVLQRTDTLLPENAAPDLPVELWPVLRRCMERLVYPRAPEVTVDDESILALLSPEGVSSSLERLTLAATGHLSKIKLPDLSRRRPFAPKLYAPEGEVTAVVGDRGFGTSARALEATAYALGEPTLQALGGLLADLWLLELSLATNIFTQGDLSERGSDMLAEADVITARGLEDEMRIVQPIAEQSALIRDLLAAAQRTIAGVAKIGKPSRLKQMDWRDAAGSVLNILGDNRTQ